MSKLKRNKYIRNAIIVIILALSFKVLFLQKEKPIDELLFEVPEMPETLSYNDKIKFAFDTFVLFAKKQSSKSLVCKGGFLNTEKYQTLQEISHTIISNRVINPYPLEFASTQDEAGIICLSSKDKFVLFAPLNEDEENEPNFWCVDSNLRKGRLEVSRDRIACR